MREHFPISENSWIYQLSIIQNKSMKKIMTKGLEIPNLIKMSLKMKLTTLLLITSIFYIQAPPESGWFIVSHSVSFNSDIKYFSN